MNQTEAIKTLIYFANKVITHKELSEADTMAAIQANIRLRKDLSKEKNNGNSST